MVPPKRMSFLAWLTCFALLIISNVLGETFEIGKAHSMISKVQTECELAALNIGTILSNHFTYFDDETEWDQRLHDDFITEHMGFYPWIQSGTWKSGGLTTLKSEATALYKKGGWTSSSDQGRQSSYWALYKKWVYMLGDSTTRQVWNSLSNPFKGNEFEHDKSKLKETCRRQAPHRMEHPPDRWFANEGWGGRCGNNEQTCEVTGFGVEGRLTLDWKHFPFEDYDEWLFGESGLWGAEAQRIPDVLVIQIGVHTCYHAFMEGKQPFNYTLVDNHANSLPLLMRAIQAALTRWTKLHGAPHNTTVVFMTGGRLNPVEDAQLDRCTYSLNRKTVLAAHQHGFAVLEREEIEHRLLFKSNHHPKRVWLTPKMHLDEPAPSIVATSLLALVSCLAVNDSALNPSLHPFHLFHKKRVDRVSRAD